MDLLYLFIILIIVAIVLAAVLVYFIIDSRRGKSSGSYIETRGGIDIDKSVLSGSGFKGFSGFSRGTVVAERNIRAVVYLEDCVSGRAYAAKLNPASVIGRIVPDSMEINDLSVSRSRNVSRRHCRLFESGGRIFLENLSKTNSTKLNSVSICEPTVVRVGDIITISDVDLRIMGMKRY